MLQERDSKCALCGVTHPAFLIASHIKPWSDSTNQERLDVDNGLLLCPNHDALFDKGLITFNQDGSIIISPSLDKSSRVLLNVSKTMVLSLNDWQKQYMSYHREKIFRR